MCDAESTGNGLPSLLRLRCRTCIGAAYKVTDSWFSSAWIASNIPPEPLCSRLY